MDEEREERFAGPDAEAGVSEDDMASCSLRSEWQASNQHQPLAVNITSPLSVDFNESRHVVGTCGAKAAGGAKCGVAAAACRQCRSVANLPISRKSIARLLDHGRRLKRAPQDLWSQAASPVAAMCASTSVTTSWLLAASHCHFIVTASAAASKQRSSHSCGSHCRPRRT